MKTYQFESIIQPNGSIILPRHMNRLKTHRVKLTLVDLESTCDNPANVLAEIIKRYATIDESDLDIAKIYTQREEHHVREIVFD